MKNGNFTFKGIFKDILDGTTEYFNARSNNKCINIIELNYKLLYSPSDASYKYVPLDPAQVTKYGLWGALLQSLDKNVRYM